MSTSVCPDRCSPASEPWPLTRLKTPFGKPISSIISARIKAFRGASLDGLRTIVQPAAIAGATFPIIWCKGKFHGVIKAQTPTGSLTTNELRTSSSQLNSSNILAYDLETTRGVPTIAILLYSMGVPTSAVMS